MGTLRFKQDLWTWLRSCDAANVVTHALVTCLPPCHAHPPAWSWKWKLAAGEAVSSSLIIRHSPMWRQTDRSRSSRVQAGGSTTARLWGRHRQKPVSTLNQSGGNSPFPNRRVEKQMALPQIRTQNERLCLTSLKVPNAGR